MKSCGVIVEYNPFHNGHRYHLEQARKVSSADVVIAIMSGNFLQRGEPAILDKWIRANEALINGADLVIELPFAYAIQSADYFAKGGIKLLQALGCEALCFGTDRLENLDYEAFGRLHVENEEEINRRFQKMSHEGHSYPQQMTKIYQDLFPDWSLDSSSPNHILGMSYAKENARYRQPMSLFPIKRRGNGYHDKVLPDHSFASATSIREAVLYENHHNLEKVVPSKTANDLLEKELVSWEKAWPLLRYQLLVQTPSSLKGIYQMVEGLEYRLKEAAKKASSFEEFIGLVKTKRYTWTRIQRLCLYVLEQVTVNDIKEVWEHSYLRVLGFNDLGRLFLKQRKKECLLPIITNVNKKNESLLSLDIRAGQIYQQLSGLEEQQDYYRSPIYIRSVE